jgi:ADP-heptose:LPS heptosyltransferase
VRASENRVLRRIFVSKKDEITRVWRKLHNEELDDLYTSPKIVRVIKSRRMRWAEHVALMGRGEAYSGFWWGNLRERNHFEDPGVDGNIILISIFRN